MNSCPFECNEIEALKRAPEETAIRCNEQLEGWGWAVMRESPKHADGRGLPATGKRLLRCGSRKQELLPDVRGMQDVANLFAACN